MSTALLTSLFLAAAIPLPAGSDSCATPEMIYGQGSFAFDLTAATTGTEGQIESLCGVASGTAIENDVWFAWTAPRDGRVRLFTCGLTTVDTKIAVYPDGGCPVDGMALACNDDICGAQSTVEWDVLAGSIYTIQIGTAPGATAGSGTFELYVGANYSNNLALGGTATQSSTGWSGTPDRGIDGNTDGIYSNNSCTHTTDLSNSWWEVDLGTDVSMSEILLYNRLDCCHTRLSNFRVSVFSGTAEVFGQDYYVGTGFVPANGVHQVLVPTGTSGNLVRVGFNGLNNDNNGLLTLAEVEILAGSPGIPFCTGDGTGLPCPCGNDTGVAGAGCGNSTGPGATLTTAGSPSVLADDLSFHGTDLVPGQVALLFQGNNALGGGAGILFGDGLRCAGVAVRRLAWSPVDSAGAASWGPGLATVGAWATGDTRRFQVWYGDVVASPCGMSFNTTNGIELLLQP